MTTTRITCPKCHGHKTIRAFAGIDNGKCHLCMGAGFLLVDEEQVAAALPARADIIARTANALELFRKYDDIHILAGCVAIAPADVQARALAAIDRIDPSGNSSRYVTRCLEEERARYLAGRRVRAVRPVV